MDPMVERELAEHGGWIDAGVLETMLQKPMTFVCAVDGSDISMAGLHYVTEGVMQQNRETFCEVLHVFDDTKEYLPRRWRSDAMRATVSAKLMSSVSDKRYRLAWEPKEANVERHLTERVKAKQASFAVMGHCGRKGKKDKNLLGSNVQAAIQNCQCACIVLKDEDPANLPIRRVSKFVVSVSLNQASTKAFVDALRLSQPGDEIHVVYVKSFMERTESDYTSKLREKYGAFFAGLKGDQTEDGSQNGTQSCLLKFQDRKTEFVMVTKQRRESTAQAVVRYAESIEADFMCVGTNTLRVQRGKKPLGSVSLDICMEWEGNFIVSHWLDISPELYKEYGGGLGGTSS